MEHLDGSPILVTGAGGFIGSAVIRALAAAGPVVHALLGPPHAPFVPSPPGTPSAFAEITDLQSLRPVVKDVGTVIHLAGPASVAASFRDSAEYARVHVGGTATLLEACRDAGVGRFVYLSSAELYGQPDTNPVDEEQPPRPRSPYAAAKLGAESMVRALAPTLGLEAVILRPFSVYGPGMASRSLVGTLLDQAVSSDAVTLADLRPIRDYCYIDDVADAVARAGTEPMAEAFAVYNVGSGTGTSVADLARLVLATVGRNVEVRLGNLDRPPGSDILSLVADVRRIEHDLGWHAATSLSDGLAVTAASVRTERG